MTDLAGDCTRVAEILLSHGVRVNPNRTAKERLALYIQREPRETGSFHFSAIEPGAYTLTITAGGFTDEKTNVSVVSGENPPLPPVVLQIAPAISKVDVTLPPQIPLRKSREGVKDPD
jgi:hypothetical protein